MTEMCLGIACGDYDRIRLIWLGSFNAKGLDMIALRLPLKNVFFRMTRY